MSSDYDDYYDDYDGRGDYDDWYAETFFAELARLFIEREREAIVVDMVDDGDGS